MKLNKKQIAIILNLWLLVMEVMGFVIAIRNNGIKILGFYTQESNLILLIATIFYLASMFGNDMLENVKVKKWVAMFKYVGVCLVAVTFAVVVFAFVPMCIPYGGKAVYDVLFGGANFCHHFGCPIFALVSYLFFENDFIPDVKSALIAMVPTLLYAIVATTLNILKIIEGPYPFLYVYEQPVFVSVLWFIGIPLGGFLFAWLVGLIKKKLN